MLAHHSRSEYVPNMTISVIDEAHWQVTVPDDADDEVNQLLISELQDDVEEFERWGMNLAVHTKAMDEQDAQNSEKGILMSEIIEQAQASLQADKPSATDVNAKWQTVLLARHPKRPIFLDYVSQLFTEFDELTATEHLPMTEQ